MRLVDVLAQRNAIKVIEMVMNGKADDYDFSSLTRKQFYTSMHVLVKHGVVDRKAGHYRLTLQGLILADIIILLDKITDNQKRLHAADKVVYMEGVSKENKAVMIDSLIIDKELHEMVEKILPVLPMLSDDITKLR